MRCKWLGLVCSVVLVLVVVAVGCIDQNHDSADEDGDDDGADYYQGLLEQLHATTAEIIEGQMARTAAALEEKVFVHISDDYTYAGFDKDGLIQDQLDELIDNDDLRIDDYELEIDVGLSYDYSKARVTTTNMVTATIVADDEDDFDIVIIGSTRSILIFEMEENDIFRVVGFRAAFNTWDGSGGAADLAAKGLSDTTLDLTEIGPGDAVTVQGAVELPAVPEGAEIWLNVLVEWGDDRNNAEQWPWQEEIVSRVDVTEFAGTSYDLDVEMPGDGDPAGLAIPAALPLGVDEVSVGVQVLVVDDQGELLRADVRNFSIPFAPLTNAEPCDPGPNPQLDGLWYGAATGAYGSYEITEYPVFDLAVVGNDVYGAVGYASDMYDEGFAPVLLPVTGTVAGNDVLFAFVDEDFEMGFEATLEGTSLVDGVMTMAAEGFYVDLDFSADKLDDRCEGVDWADLDGAAFAVSAAGFDELFTLVEGDEEWTLSGADVEYEAYPARNLLIAVNAESWLVLAFYNDEEGWMTMPGDDAPTSGAFIVQ